MIRVEHFHGMSMEDVKQKVRQSKDTRIFERWLCVSCSMKGQSVTEIAGLLFRNEQCVRDWIESFNRAGPQGLERMSPPGQGKKNQR